METRGSGAAGGGLLALRQRRAPTKRGGASGGPHPHPVLRHPLQAHHAGLEQSAIAVDQELFQESAVAEAEVVQRLVVHTDAAV